MNRHYPPKGLLTGSQGGSSRFFQPTDRVCLSIGRSGDFRKVEQYVSPRSPKLSRSATLKAMKQTEQGAIDRKGTRFLHLNHCPQQLAQLQIKIVASPGFGPIFGILARNGVVFGKGGFESLI
jgi:hypothetical protein